MMGAIAFQKGLGATHSLAHPLSTDCRMHHGTANAVLLPWVLVEFSVPAVWLGLLALPLVWLGTEAFSRVQPRMEDCPLDGPRWYRQAAVAAVASALAFPLLGA